MSSRQLRRLQTEEPLIISSESEEDQINEVSNPYQLLDVEDTEASEIMPEITQWSVGQKKKKKPKKKDIVIPVSQPHFDTVVEDSYILEFLWVRRSVLNPQNELKNIFGSQIVKRGSFPSSLSKGPLVVTAEILFYEIEI